MCVCVFDMHIFEEVVICSVTVRSWENNYSCHFLVLPPPPIGQYLECISEGYELLLSANNIIGPILVGPLSEVPQWYSAV